MIFHYLANKCLFSNLFQYFYSCLLDLLTDLLRSFVWFLRLFVHVESLSLLLAYCLPPLYKYSPREAIKQSYCFFL